MYYFPVVLLFWSACITRPCIYLLHREKKDLGKGRKMLRSLGDITQIKKEIRRQKRVSNDLQRTKLSCGLMIRLLAYPLPPLSRQQFVSLSPSSCVSPVELERGQGGWARSQIIRPRESLALYKLLNILWTTAEKVWASSIIFSSRCRAFARFQSVSTQRSAINYPSRVNLRHSYF